MRYDPIYKAISGRSETSQHESEKLGISQEELKEITDDIYHSHKEFEAEQCQLQEQFYRIEQLEESDDISSSGKRELQELTEKLGTEKEQLMLAWKHYHD